MGEALNIVINEHLSLAPRRDAHAWRYQRLYFEEVRGMSLRICPSPACEAIEAVSVMA